MPGGNTIDLSDVASGDYTLTVADNNGCEASLAFNIPDQVAPSLAGGVVSDAACGNDTGAIEGIVTTDGTAPLTYTWTNSSGISVGDGSADLINVPADTYDLEIVDNNGCVDNISFEIANIPGPSLSGGDISDEACGQENGSILNVIETDGTAPFTYQWFTGGVPIVGENN